MSVYRIEENRLRIDDAAKSRFAVAHDAFGCGIAYSSDTLIVFYDECGTQTFAINPPPFRWLIAKFFVLDGSLYNGPFKLGRINPDAILGYTAFYAWDQKTVYYMNGPVAGANPAFFQDLGHFWARDARKCFFQEREIPGADAASFRVVADHTFAADKDRLYAFGGRVVAERCPDPVPLGNGYYNLAGTVFFGGTRMPDADLQTFQVLPVFSPEDKRRIWASGGPKHETESLAISGFTAFDSKHKYRGASRAPERKRPTA